MSLLRWVLPIEHPGNTLRLVQIDDVSPQIHYTGSWQNDFRSGEPISFPLDLVMG